MVWEGEPPGEPQENGMITARTQKTFGNTLVGVRTACATSLRVCVVVAFATLCAVPLAADAGSEPVLPSGLNGHGSASVEPAPPARRPRVQWDVSGFLDARAGIRTQTGPYHDDPSLAETRWHYRLEGRGDSFSIILAADMIADLLEDDQVIDLESGRSAVDLREAHTQFRAGRLLDLKAGRQILSWGTGDMLFVNDLFPKDWVALLIGRDEAYLKAPSDAIRLGFFPGPVSLDLVYTPRFDADRFPDGTRLSLFNPLLGEVTGEDAPLDTRQPDRWFADDEWAARLYGNAAGYELALYGYRGFWKTPAGIDPVTAQATFPRLSVYGASVRGYLLAGIGNAEIGYYDSRDDQDGSDPLVRNSEWRALIGYQKDMPGDLLFGAQYYIEHMLDYGRYRNTLPETTPAAKGNRHVLTARLTKRALRQDLLLSMFVLYSPSDHDAYLRVLAQYRINDTWSVSAGGNLLAGKDPWTQFGQFESNSNVYLATRISF
jgi:hypothetical protein